MPIFWRIIFRITLLFAIEYVINHNAFTWKLSLCPKAPNESERVFIKQRFFFVKVVHVAKDVLQCLHLVVTAFGTQIFWWPPVPYKYTGIYQTNRLQRWYVTIASLDQRLPQTIPFNRDGAFENYWHFSMVAKTEFNDQQLQ